MDFNIPVYVENIIDKLEGKNYEAYIVGGSVRDLLIGREPSDYDNNRIGIAIQLYRTFRIRSRGILSLHYA